MPFLVLLLCPDLPLLVHLLVLPRNLLPTFVSCSLPIPPCVVISSVTHYVSANKRNRNKSALLTDVTASPAKLHTRDVHLEIILSRFRILQTFFLINHGAVARKALLSYYNGNGVVRIEQKMYLKIVLRILLIKKTIMKVVSVLDAMMKKI